MKYVPKELKSSSFYQQLFTIVSQLWKISRKLDIGAKPCEFFIAIELALRGNLLYITYSCVG